MLAADRLTGLLRRGDARVPPALPALLLAAVLLADGAVVLSRSTLAPLPPAAAPTVAAPQLPVAPPAPPVVPGPAPTVAPPPPVVSDHSPPASAPSPAAPVAAAPETSPEQRAGQLRLAVPVLGVDAEASSLGTRSDGSLEVPRTARDVGWYADGVLPGEVGPAVFAGHVDLDGRAGVFAELTRMRPGDLVEVVRPDGRTVAFVVTRVEQHAKSEFPTDAVYAPTATPELRLVTCGGAFDRRSGSYRDNVVVFAALAA